MNYKIIGNDAAISSCFDSDDFGLVAVGQIKSAKEFLLFDLLRKNKKLSQQQLNQKIL